MTADALTANCRGPGTDPDAVLAVREAPLLIVEWQQASDVLGAIKRAVDTDRRPGRFVLTGSVRGELTAAQWPGTGRVVPLHLFGLHPLETEVVEHRDPRWSRLFIDRCFDIGRSLTVASTPDWALPRYVERALDSGFPAVADIDSPRIRDRWLGSHVERLLERDVVEVASRIDTRRLRRFAEAVAAHTSTDVATATLAESVTRSGTDWSVRCSCTSVRTPSDWRTAVDAAPIAALWLD